MKRHLFNLLRVAILAVLLTGLWQTLQNGGDMPQGTPTGNAGMGGIVSDLWNHLVK